MRRLAERVEYSQPVLYSHFSGRADIVPVDLPFAVADTPAAARSGFSEFVAALTPLAGSRDVDTLAEQPTGPAGAQPAD